MKTNVSVLTGLLLTGISLSAQYSSKKPVVGILSIDTESLNADPSTMANIVRTELEKLDTFDVRDKYDTQQFLEQNKTGINNCYGKSCLTEVGLQLKCDNMFTGFVEPRGKNIVFTYRLINVKTGYTTKAYVHEFLNIPEELQNMVKLSVAEMFDRPFDKNMMAKLSKPFDFDNSNNNPTVDRLRLDGPRMGFVGFTGDMQKVMMEKKKNGGFDAFPAMFQFGYQFEKQYLNEGKMQALFEFIPMITGLDQGYFIPSVTLMHGLRSNVDGWEFAFGPTFNILPVASGYFDDKGQWQLKSAWDNDRVQNPHEIQDRLDSRGEYRVHSAFVLAVGRTFKSGKLNIPVNAFVVPGRSGWRFGVSFGFNTRNTPKLQY